jgi:hypothetical protein
MPAFQATDRKETLFVLNEELKDKEAGYTAYLSVAGRLFPEMQGPHIEIILTDPVEMNVTYRRFGDPLRDESDTVWQTGGLREVVEEAFSWREELKKDENVADQMKASVKSESAGRVSSEDADTQQPEAISPDDSLTKP